MPAFRTESFGHIAVTTLRGQDVLQRWPCLCAALWRGRRRRRRRPCQVVSRSTSTGRLIWACCRWKAARSFFGTVSRDPQPQRTLCSPMAGFPPPVTRPGSNSAETPPSRARASGLLSRPTACTSRPATRRTRFRSMRSTRDSFSRRATANLPWVAVRVSSMMFFRRTGSRTIWAWCELPILHGRPS